jgi:hypothetical protein
MLQRWRPTDFAYSLDWFRHARRALNPRILDIGCEPGYLLAALHHQGLEKLEGQDLFPQRFLPGTSCARRPTSCREATPSSCCTIRSSTCPIRCARWRP